MKKNFFLTLDLEEWYHLDYFQKYDIVNSQSISMVDSLAPFLDMLDTHGVKITVFVLGELIEKHSKTIIEFSKRGHEIGIHGWDHVLLHKKKKDAFLKEILRAKKALEELISKEVVGYRAPCFSLNNEKLEGLKEIGILYDSSFIEFKDHPLYGSLNMGSFNKIDDLIFEKNGFYEFQLPTISMLGKNIPISGGGYFRLFPKFLFKILWKIYLKSHHNFNLYIHPFELTENKVDIGDASRGEKFRFSVGRKGNLQKLEWLIIKAKKEGFIFVPIKEWINGSKTNI